MERLRFRELELEAFVHATETREAVEAAMLAVAPGARVEQESLRGHFGQRMLILRGRLRDAAAVDRVAERLRAAVGAELAATADRRIDVQGRVFARLDKQAAAGGRLAIARDVQTDVIKLQVRITRPPRRRADLLAAFESQFGAGGRGGREREEE